VIEIDGIVVSAQTRSDTPRRTFPRVLIVYKSRVNAEDSFNVSLRGWFREWPTERLAQIYSGGVVGERSFCGDEFALGPRERFLGRLFARLKGSAMDQDRIFRQSSTSTTGPARARRRLIEGVVASGIWELLFPPKLSRGLLEWVRRFRPDVIYCQGYDLTFARLPMMLHRSVGVPICFQTGDDWPSYLYSGTWASWFMRPLVRRVVADLVRHSAVRIANGPQMREEYERRYGVRFEQIMMADEPQRFQQAPATRLANEDTRVLFYSGSVGLGRVSLLVQISRAAARISMTSRNVILAVMSTYSSVADRHALETLPNVRLLDNPTHDELPGYLKGADVLVLAESFNSHWARMCKLSVSTKAHLYMMAKRPILVIGPGRSSLVLYANQAGWAHVIDEENYDMLDGAIERLLSDAAYARELVERADRAVLDNHLLSRCSEHFRGFLADAAQAPLSLGTGGRPVAR
jgi:glycosyltransferase involved in cell wall biosynthesis